MIGRRIRVCSDHSLSMATASCNKSPPELQLVCVARRCHDLLKAIQRTTLGSCKEHFLPWLGWDRFWQPAPRHRYWTRPRYTCPENDHISPIGNWSSLPNKSWDHPAAELGRWPWACWRSGSWRVCCGTGIYKHRISHAPLSFDCSQSHTLS